MFNIVCPVCNKKFNTEHKKQRCCSHKCGSIGSWKNRKTGKLMKCEQCGKEVYVIKSRVSKFRFCSRSCQGKHIFGNEELQKRIKHPRGKNHPGWKGGTISQHGYKKIHVDGKQYYEHRYLMEKFLGRKLTFNETIHHIDGNKLNNSMENLVLIDRKEHSLKYHNQGSRRH